MNNSDLTLLPEYVNHLTEKQMLLRIWLAMEPLLKHAGEHRSRILRYGWDYEHPEKKLEPIPEWVPRIENNANDFNAVTINEYLVGQHISPHVDSAAFGPTIAILSLGQPAVMQLDSPDKSEQRIMELPARSLLFMSGEVRRLWKHSTIPIQAGGRYSVVYRAKP